MKLYIDSLENDKEELKRENKLIKKKLKLAIQQLKNNKSIDNSSSFLSNITLNIDDKSSQSSNEEKRGEEEKSESSSIIKNKKKKQIMEEIEKYEEKINRLNKLINVYEEQNFKLNNNIKKLKIQKMNEIKDIENKYRKENKSLKKQLAIYESKLKQINDNKNKANLNTNKKNISSVDKESKNKINKKLLKKKDKEDLSFLLNKTTTLRKQTSSLSAPSSIDKIDKYLNRKFSTLRAQRTSSVLKARKKERYNSVLYKKKAEDLLLKLFLSDLSRQNLTERLKSSKIVQKSTENNNKKIRKKKSTLKEKISSNMKKNSSGIFKSNSKNNLFEMINNINIFANNLKQNNHNVYYKSNNNSNNSSSTFISNIYRNNNFKQYTNSVNCINHKNK